MEETQTKTKFCKHCGEKIPEDAIICNQCGRQVEQLKSEQPQMVVNNTNTNTNTSENENENENKNTNTNINNNAGYRREKNKWIAFLLCFFLGFLGAHKFYEGKILLGIVYFCTCGLLGIGVLIDFFSLLFKPNPYYV